MENLENEKVAWGREKVKKQNGMSMIIISKLH